MRVSDYSPELNHIDLPFLIHKKISSGKGSQTRKFKFRPQKEYNLTFLYLTNLRCVLSISYYLRLK